MKGNTMKAKATYTPASKETPASIRDVIKVKTALAALLVEETDYMNTMQIAKVGELQERKLKLTGLLERYTRYLSQHTELLAGVTAEEKAELKKVTDSFHTAMRKNYDTLLVARAVNGAIVKCVTQAATKKDNNPIYNAHGAVGQGTGRAVSITLNQTV